LQGRDFTQDDQIEGAPLVFVVNQAFVKKYFPSVDPLSPSISVNMQRPENPYRPIIASWGM